MRLKGLSIRYSEWPKPGGYIGKVEFTGKAGDVILNLSEKHAAAILKIVATSLVDASKEAANCLTAEIIEGTAAAELPTQPLAAVKGDEA